MQIKKGVCECHTPVAVQQQERAAPPTFFHQSGARPRAQIQTRFRKKAGREIRRDGQKMKQKEWKKTHALRTQYRVTVQRGVCSMRTRLTQSYIYGFSSFTILRSH